MTMYVVKNFLYYTRVMTLSLKPLFCVLNINSLVIRLFIDLYLLIIRGAFRDNFHGFSGFGFCKKLAQTKTQQGTDKASEQKRVYMCVS